MKSEIEIGIVSVVGLGYTGSSALIDYFKSIEEVSLIESEFFLFRIVDGFFDLYNDLFNADYDVVMRQYIVNKFINVMKKLSIFRYTHEKKFNFLNLHFHLPIPIRVLGDELVKNILDFVDELIIGKSKVSLVHSYLTMSSLKLITYKLITRILGVFFRLKLLNKRIYLKERVNLYTNDRNVFIIALNNFLRKLANDLNFDNDKLIVLNQSINPLELDRMPEMIPNHKIIIVTRDPRDIYAEALKYNIEWMIGSGDRENKLSRFIEYQTKKITKLGGASKKPNVKLIKFEDLCLNPTKTINAVRSFLDLSEVQEKIYMYFSPLASSRNINIYEDILSKREAQIIYQEINNNLKYYQ